MFLVRWQHHVMGKSLWPRRAKATWLRVAMDRSGKNNELGVVEGGRKRFSTSSRTMMAAPALLRCDPKLFEKDLTDRVIIVTGANSGCGLETSRQLSKQGATVILACREADTTEAALSPEAAAAKINGTYLSPLDLSSLQSVRGFVDVFQKKYNRLDGLVNNAGIMGCPYQTTADGFEMQLGVNHLGHFLLMQLLTPLLLDTADKTKKPSRFVALSSCGAAKTTMMTKNDPFIDFDDLNWKRREYQPSGAYSQSKLANYLHVLGASMKYSHDKLICTSVHPGWVYSPLDRDVIKRLIGEGPLKENVVAPILKKLLQWKGDIISPADGAQTTLHCLLADNIQSGKFYSQVGIYQDESSRKGGWPMDLPNPNATPEAAMKLWDTSEKMVGIET
mmetsp:Transcript_25320/g.53487  ORF Transcript_25320/g.53487 Transcript_25320/m.53487 type:complete len:391 (-) Transcript_25320:565-1737(-)